MDRKLKDKLREALSHFSAVQYVRISKNDAFYLFKEIDATLPKTCIDFDIDKNGHTIPDPFTYYPCVVLHQNILYEDPKVATYIEKYRHKIDASPGFHVQNILSNRIKIRSKKHITPIRNLLREIGVMEEKRGKGKKPDETTKELRAFVIEQYKSMQSNREFRIKTLQNRLAKEVLRRFPDNAKIADKYNWSDATIRRIIKSCKKKRISS
jgi:hypothetical protein